MMELELVPPLGSTPTAGAGSTSAAAGGAGTSAAGAGGGSAAGAGSWPVGQRSFGLLWHELLTFSLFSPLGPIPEIPVPGSHT